MHDACTTAYRYRSRPGPYNTHQTLQPKSHHRPRLLCSTSHINSHHTFKSKMASRTGIHGTQELKRRSRNANSAEPKATPTPVAINPKWYKNSELSDVTIVYGFNGEKKYEAHRFILCNASQWFMNASRNPRFIEANDRVITLKEDHPDALDALFEFAYKGKYQHGGRSTAQSFLLHARVFIAADKYMADNLEAWALKKFRDLCQYELDSRHMSFFKFAVQQLWGDSNPFGLDQFRSDENSQRRTEQEKGNEEPHDQEDRNMEFENDEMNSNKGFDQSDPGWEIDDAEVDEAGYTSDEVRDIDEIADVPESSNPLDQLRAMVIDYILQLLGRGDEADDPLYFQILCRDIPEFGEDFMAAMLSGKVKFEYGSRF